MFKRILVAYDGSSESGRALIAGIQLAKNLNADLRTVYVYEKLPLYAAGFMDIGVLGATVVLPLQVSQYYRKLRFNAQQTARQQGMALKTELVEGDEVKAIVESVQRTGSDSWSWVYHGVTDYSAAYGTTRPTTYEYHQQRILSHDD